MALPRHEQIAQLDKGIRIHERTLSNLDTQIAQYGGRMAAPVALLNQYDDVTQLLTIAKTERERLLSVSDSVTSPYRGLLAFQESHTHLFFGRDALITQLVAQVEHAPFLAVLGPSGTGKSSVIRAGLLPSLKGGALSGSDTWRYVMFTPGDQPLDALATELAKLQGGNLADITEQSSRLRDQLIADSQALQRICSLLIDPMVNQQLVLVVDQFEELWTLAPTDTAAHTSFVAQQQQPFIDQLLNATRTEGSPLRVVLAMRADFLHRAAEHRALADRLSQCLTVVGPMTQSELHDAIVCPVEATGGDFETGLVEVLLNDVAGQAGSLPLLEHALLELWELRDGNRLTHAAYRQIGGLAQALEQRAENVYQSFTPEEQVMCRRIFLRLVQIDEGETKYTKRRVPLRELLPSSGNAPVLTTVIQRLASDQNRLITTDAPIAIVERVDSSAANSAEEQYLELAHEVLIDAWQRIRNWLAENRSYLLLQRRLTESTEEWHDHEKASDFLYSGSRLAEAQRYADKNRQDLSRMEIEFLTASSAQAKRRERSYYLGQALISAQGSALGYGTAFALGWLATSPPSTSQLAILAFLFMFPVGEIVGFTIGMGQWSDQDRPVQRVMATGALSAILGGAAYWLFLSFFTIGPVTSFNFLIGALLAGGIAVGASFDNKRRNRLIGSILGGVISFGIAGFTKGLPWPMPIILIAGVLLGGMTGLGFQVLDEQ